MKNKDQIDYINFDKSHQGIVDTHAHFHKDNIEELY